MADGKTEAALLAEISLILAAVFWGTNCATEWLLRVAEDTHPCILDVPSQ